MTLFTANAMPAVSYKSIMAQSTVILKLRCTKKKKGEEEWRVQLHTFFRQLPLFSLLDFLFISLSRVYCFCLF